MAAPRKTTAKKSTAKGRPKVKMIQTVDFAPGKDTTVIFTDGTRAIVKADSKLTAMLQQPESVAPNLIQVYMSGKNIVDAEPVVLDKTDE